MEKAIKLNIDQKYYPAISRFFSPIVLMNIEKNYYSTYLSEVCQNSGILNEIDLSITFGKFLNTVFHFLLKHYRNEYIIKNVIANKILLGRHSLNTSQMLTEFRIGSNKADVVILNGSSTVYEIKSQYDTFKRLDKQVQSYCAAFEYVNVVTTPFQLKSIISRLPENVGLVSFTKNDTLSMIRKPKSNLENIKLEVLFDSLRKNEYLAIIAEYYKTIPDVPNTRIYQMCKELYCKIPLSDALKLTYAILKKRNNSELLINYIDKIPYSVFSYVLGIDDKRNRIERIVNIFNRGFKEFI